MPRQTFYFQTAFQAGLTFNSLANDVLFHDLEEELGKTYDESAKRSRRMFPDLVRSGWPRNMRTKRNLPGRIDDWMICVEDLLKVVRCPDINSLLVVLWRAVLLLESCDFGARRRTKRCSGNRPSLCQRNAMWYTREKDGKRKPGCAFVSSHCNRPITFVSEYNITLRWMKRIKSRFKNITNRNTNHSTNKFSKVIFEYIWYNFQNI